MRRVAQQLLLRQGAAAGRATTSAAAAAGESAATAAADTTRVAVLDPKALLQPGRYAALRDAHAAGQGAAPSVTVDVPSSLLQRLSVGKHVLGEFDDPQSSWCFGEVDEVFRYTFVGSHAVTSGLTCLLPEAELHAVLQQQGGKDGTAAHGAATWTPPSLPATPLSAGAAGNSDSTSSSSEGRSTLPSWEEFAAWHEAIESVREAETTVEYDPGAGAATAPGGLPPLLFCGRLLDCDSASVAVLRRNGQVVGLSVTSDV